MFTQQLTIESRVKSQTLGDGQDDLAMRDEKANFSGNVAPGQQRPLLMAERVRAPKHATNSQWKSRSGQPIAGNLTPPPENETSG